jgi:hypothetical protein
MAEKVQPDSTMFFNKAAAGRPLFIEEQPKSNLITLASFDEDYRCSAAMDSSGGVCQRKAIKVSPSYTERFGTAMRTATCISQLARPNTHEKGSF